MKLRKFMIYVHLIIGSLFLPLMLLMPLTGSLHLWGYSGDAPKTEAFRVHGEVPKDEKDQAEFFRTLFQEKKIDFNFEYIRTSRGEFIFRPTSRAHYTATQEGNEIVFSLVKPSLVRRLMEVHKGHGPLFMRWFESAFGMALILVTLSGLWLAITVQPYRRATVLSFAVGAGIILFCLI